jgi:L-seryl-tRNA(Ser) seleniumtransferase
MNKELLRNIPKVDEIIKEFVNKEIPFKNRELLTNSIREVIENLRNKIISNEVKDISMDILVEEIIYEMEKKDEYSLTKVINGTGVVLHTNLGRALLSKQAELAVSSVLGSYSNLEFDLITGKRGERYFHVEKLLSEITGANSALVVNNNAAAVMLVLSSLCNGDEVIVSRGELVEIGGSFRIPDVMKLSGAKLVEIGTTNKTHYKDYINAINENTKAILKVHTSNYRIMGFTDSVSTKELSQLSKEYGLLLIEDLGSGSLIDLSEFGYSKEPTVQEQISNGIDVLTFSGDKLLGGPQCGIILGSIENIERMKKNQLTRAIRVDKMTIAALEGTLRHYRSKQDAIENIPVLNMLTMPKEHIYNKADYFVKAIPELVSLSECKSQVGGGSLPLDTIDSYCLRLISSKKSANTLSRELRELNIPIIIRIEEDNAIIDLRTVFEEDFDYIIDILKEVL